MRRPSWRRSRSKGVRPGKVEGFLSKKNISRLYNASESAVESSSRQECDTRPGDDEEAMARHPEKPANCTEVTLYSGLEWYAQGWLKHTIGNLIIVGPTSIGKSETIKKVAGTNHLLLQGMGSGVNAYQKIY